MSIFFWSALAHYGLPVALALALLVLLALAGRLLDYWRGVVYRAAVDALEIRARWHGQGLDRKRQAAALEISSQAQRLQLAAGHEMTLDQARWLLAHQNDVELEAAPGDHQPG